MDVLPLRGGREADRAPDASAVAALRALQVPPVPPPGPAAPVAELGPMLNDALLADYGGLCDLLEVGGLVAAGAVIPAASSASAPPDWGPLVLPSGAERR